ncbi:MAG: glycosyltransferase [Sphingomonadales bacterium]
MTDPLVWLAGLTAVIWLYLLGFHHRFWRADQRLDHDLPEPERWPGVVAVVPARNEAEVIGRTLGALAAQVYPGAFSIVLVNDSSTDGTGEIARNIVNAGLLAPVQVLDGRPLAEGWTGKLWALDQGVAQARTMAPDASYLWFTDADIEHDQDTLRRLVAKAEAGRRDLVSLMVRLSCESFWERLIIPAFVFFFQMLYPFPAVNRDGVKIAGAAGGCVLLRRAMLDRIGGIEAIKGALIDDCALAGAVKRSGGGLWLGLGEESRGIRPYQGLGELWDMIARGAYTQLRFSPMLLVGTVAGMAITYLAPALIGAGFLVHQNPAAGMLGAGAWLLMIGCYAPTLSYYRLPWVNGLLLPIVAGLYTLMTIDSAWRHWRGRGGQWKQRHYAARKTDSC